MNKISLSGRFLKEGLIVFLFFIILTEGVSWISGYAIKLNHVDSIGGVAPYIFLYVRTILLPEMTTVFLLTFLMYWVNHRFGIKSINLTWLSIGRYELLFLPVILLAFVIINPFTQSVRFLLENFPNYSFARYWNSYIVDTFTWRFYVLYLFPILAIGYTTLNLSLLLDYLKSTDSPEQLEIGQ